MQNTQNTDIKAAPLVNETPVDSLYRILFFLLLALTFSFFSVFGFIRAGLFISLSEFPFIFTTAENGTELIILGLLFNVPSIAIFSYVFKYTVKGVFTWNVYRSALIKAGYTLLGIIIVVTVGSLILSAGSIIFTAYKNTGSCVEWATVTNVGGCNMFGNCSANTTSGKMELDKPVYGESVCFKKTSFLEAIKAEFQKQ